MVSTSLAHGSIDNIKEKKREKIEFDNHTVGIIFKVNRSLVHTNIWSVLLSQFNKQYLIEDIKVWTSTINYHVGIYTNSLYTSIFGMFHYVILKL